MSEGGFAPRTEALLARAESICAGRGARLTDLRRQVLGLILEQGAPTGAYHLLEHLRSRRGGGAPPTVYRALDFLMEQGLVHRVERLAAFVGCVAENGPACTHHGADAGAHAAQFLICRMCGKVTELEDPAVAAALAATARRLAFMVTKTTIEAEGICARCAASHETEETPCQ